MTDLLSTFIQSQDVMVLLIALGISMVFFYIGIKKKKMPIYTILVNFIFLLMLYVDVGTASKYFAFFTIIIESGLLTLVMNKVFLGVQGEDKIFLSYVIFFATYISLLTFTQLSSNIFVGTLPTFQTCSLSWNPLVSFSCVINYIGFFTGMFSFSSPIQILNLTLFFPFLYLVIKMLLPTIVGILQAIAAAIPL